MYPKQHLIPILFYQTRSQYHSFRHYLEIFHSHMSKELYLYILIYNIYDERSPKHLFNLFPPAVLQYLTDSCADRQRDQILEIFYGDAHTK